MQAAGNAPVEAVLFDLDGTLLDTIPDMAAATNAMREDMGLAPLPLSVITSYVGKGSEVLVCRALNDGASQSSDTERLAQGMALFRRHYQHTNGAQARIYPGVLQGLQALQAHGLPMAVVTNKPGAFTGPLLQQMGLAHFFAHAVSGDTCPEKKPHPQPLLHACKLLGVAPAHVLMVGDSINDVQAAHAAGMRVLAVPYGYTEGLPVHSLGADDIVSSIEQAALWALRPMAATDPLPNSA